jgi:hypothetical protein
MKRTALIVCLAAVLLLVMAVPAFAGQDGSSGTVYGKAVLAPYAITISGGGTDPGSPLTYEGALNSIVPEKFGSQVTVQNTGTQGAEIKIDQNQAPTTGDDTWALGGGNYNEVAVWGFHGNTCDTAVVPDAFAYPAPWHMGVLDPQLTSGGSDTFGTSFQFPTQSNSMADHYMSATISAVAPIN